MEEQTAPPYSGSSCNNAVLTATPRPLPCDNVSGPPTADRTANRLLSGVDDVAVSTTWNSHDALDQCLPKDTSGGITVEEFMALSSTEFRQTTHLPSLLSEPISDAEERPDSVDPIGAAEVLVPPRGDFPSASSISRDGSFLRRCCSHHMRASMMF